MPPTGSRSAGIACGEVRERMVGVPFATPRTSATAKPLPVPRARLLEWRGRDPHSALTVVEAAQERMPEEAAVLEPRRTRLRRKVAKVAKVPVAHLPLFGPNDRA